jgi:hypothetical protein
MAGFVGRRWEAGQATVCLDEMPQLVRIEAFIPDEDHSLEQKRQDLFGSSANSAVFLAGGGRLDVLRDERQ